MHHKHISMSLICISKYEWLSTLMVLTHLFHIDRYVTLKTRSSIRSMTIFLSLNYTTNNSGVKTIFFSEDWGGTNNTPLNITEMCCKHLSWWFITKGRYWNGQLDTKPVPINAIGVDICAVRHSVQLAKYFHLWSLSLIWCDVLFYYD